MATDGAATVARYDLGIVWLRRDLRLRDNVALYEACKACDAVCLAFVLSPPLLGSDRMGAPLVSTFFGALAGLRSEVRREGSELALLCGSFAEELISLAARIGARAVYFNEDYEPGAVARDDAVATELRRRGIDVHAHLDHVYYGADDVERSGGMPYRVFTPYKRHWLELHATAPRPPVASLRAARGRLLPGAAIGETHPDPAPESFGFSKSPRYPAASERIAWDRLTSFLELGGAAGGYRNAREYPGVDGTSRLSPQLRAGTIGIRTCVERAVKRCNESNASERASLETWISELIWRDFYQMILKRFPHVVAAPFVAAAERIAWRPPGAEFEAWAQGRTGFPLIDAGMRQLNSTGWMHNRLRMIVASFLTKNLLVDWRIGETYFERRLADADVAANNGGWQWAASTGTDAAPYFRIFNPVEQSRRFDAEGGFIKTMVPELANVPARFVHEPWTMPPLLQAEFGVTIGSDYPAPIVDLRESRERALETFKAALAPG